MTALRSRCGHYIFVLFLSSFFFFSSPNLSGRRLDVYHSSTWCVPSANLECRPVWNVLHAARWKCRTQKIVKNWPSGHHRTNFVGPYLRN